VQKGAFFVACLIFLEWFVIFIIKLVNREGQYIPPVNYTGSMAPVFGTIMFNYAMVVTVPSWCNEKTHSTDINRSLSASMVIGTVLFTIIGLLGSLTYVISPDGDLLSAIDSSPQGGLISSLSVFLFPICVVATSIPIYSIIVRYNLLENKICNKPMANFIGVILPWLVCIPFYTGKGLQEVINWSSLISSGLINFIIPFWLYVRARDYKITLTEWDRKDLDEQLGPQYRDPDYYYCFEKIRFKGGLPAAPHYVFGKCFTDTSKTPKIIAYTFMFSLSVAVIGVIIINVFAAVGIR